MLHIDNEIAAILSDLPARFRSQSNPSGMMRDDSHCIAFQSNHCGFVASSKVFALLFHIIPCDYGIAIEIQDNDEIRGVSFLDTQLIILFFRG